jgi:hypothetical protein
MMLCRASMLAAIRDRTGPLARRAWVEAKLWYRLARSSNRRFLRNAPPGHFASPIPDIGARPGERARASRWPGSAATGVELHPEAQIALAGRLAALRDDVPFPDRPTPEFRYHLDNEWFSYGDACVLHAIMSLRRPARIVEIGSGFSSAAMLDVDDRVLGGRTRMTFIEPLPARLHGLLRAEDRRRCRIVEAPVQEAPSTFFAELESNDILFVDSSHVGKSGSDLLYLLFAVLPALAPGVLVHFHDIPWPFEYPPEWFAVGRAWNEAYFVRAFLQYNDEFEILWFGGYMASEHRDVLERSDPRLLATPSAPLTVGNSSLWLRRVTDAA